jgi:hypothetical protein
MDDPPQAVFGKPGADRHQMVDGARPATSSVTLLKESTDWLAA